MKLPEFSRKPWLITIFALLICMMAFLAAGLILVGTNSLSEMDAIEDYAVLSLDG